MARTPSIEGVMAESLKLSEPVAKAPPMTPIITPEVIAIPMSQPVIPAIPTSQPVESVIPVSKSESISPSVSTADLVAKAFELPPAPPAPVSDPIIPVSEPAAPVLENKENLESVPASRPLPDEGKVVSEQPAQGSETVLPKPNSSNKAKEPMNKVNNPQFETLVLDVAHIIFGDNAPDINVRLVRMALEQVWQNRAELQSLDAIAKEIARIIFGESNTSDLNVRLVKMALERSNSIALFKAA
jgi:hypothetical protein